VRFETPPGRQLQSDWGEIATVIAGVETHVDFIVNTLGYSRRFHFWCTDSQDAEHTYEGLVRSFEHFGGVTEEVLVDNVPRNIIHLLLPGALCARACSASDRILVGGRIPSLRAT
jgi:transposase